MTILINPTLPPDFDNTPNEDRSADELAQWWGVPFIITTSFEQQQADASYEDFLARMASYSNPTDYIPPGREQWEAEKVKNRENWFAWFPDGNRYEVRCLDGGAWDRPTLLGMFGSLNDAMECARLEVV